MSGLLIWAASVVVNRALTAIEEEDQIQQRREDVFKQKQDWISSLAPLSNAVIGSDIPVVFGSKLVPGNLVRQSSASELSGITYNDSPMWMRSGLYVFASEVDRVTEVYSKIKSVSRGDLLDPLGNYTYRREDWIIYTPKKLGRSKLSYEYNPNIKQFDYTSVYGHYPNIRHTAVLTEQYGAVNVEWEKRYDADLDGVNDSSKSVVLSTSVMDQSIDFTIFPNGMPGEGILPTKPILSFTQYEQDPVVSNTPTVNTDKMFYSNLSWEVAVDSKLRDADSSNYQGYACANVGVLAKSGQHGDDKSFFFKAERKSVTGIVSTDGYRHLDHLQKVINTTVTVRDDVNGEIQVAYPGDLVGANPIVAIAEILVNTEWGLGLPKDSLDADNFIDNAQILYDEDIWVNFASSGDSLKTIFDNCATAADMVMFTSRDTGLIKIELMREGQDSGLVIGDSDIVSLAHLTVSRYEETPKAVDIQYSDDDAQKLVKYSRNNSGGSADAFTIESPYINDSSVADKVLARSAKVMTSRTARVRVTVASNSAAVPIDGGFRSLEIGDVITVGFNEYSIPQSKYRVLGVTESEQTKGTLVLTLVTDTWGNASTPYYKRTESLLATISAYPVSSPFIRATGSSYLEISHRLNPYNENDMPLRPFVSIEASAPNQEHKHFQVPTFESAEVRAKSEFTPIADLRYAIGKQDAYFSLQGFGFFPPLNSLLMIGDEMVKVTNISSKTQSAIVFIDRGCHDTVPAAHDVDTKVTLLKKVQTTRQWASIISAVPPIGPSSDFKVLNTNNSLITQELDEVEYNTWNPVEGSRQFLPPTPTNVKVNGSYDPSVLRGDASLTWNHRNHGDDFKSESPKHFLSLDGTTDGNTYRVLFYFDGSETEAKSDTTTGLSYTYSSVDMISDNGGVEPLTVRVVIEGLDTGNNNTSWQRYEYVMSYGDNIPGDGWNTDWSNNWDN
jgi:hypothetical protein